MSSSLVLLLQQNSTVLLLTTGILGLVVGSFLNVVIYRLPIMLDRSWRQQCAELLDVPSTTAEPAKPFNLIVPRSSCPFCGHAIGAVENIPVFSYLIQKGRCRHCDNPISPRYPAVEILTAVLSIVVVWKLGFSYQTVAALILTWSLIALSFIDIDRQILPDAITLPLLWIGLLISLSGAFSTPQESIIGAVLGYLSLWSLYHLFRLLTGKEGMGYGDFKLLGMFGAWLGWQYLPITILASSLVGAIFGIAMLILGRHRKGTPMPFGPYLAIAGWVAMLWGPEINQAYLQATGLH